LKPLILVTNDDGVRAEGIQHLAKALETLGDVYISAPLEERSAVSHALTIHDPVRIKKISERIFAVRGTPADCVILAVRSILPARPDLVISGINHGANLGDDIMYSGTVAGAREACYLDVPAFAISQTLQGEHAEMTLAPRFAVQLASRILESGLPPDTFLNVNVPAGECHGVMLTRQGNKVSKSNVVENADPRGRKYFWIGEDRRNWPWASNDGSDYDAIAQGCISVTPLHRDQTNYEALKQMLQEGPYQAMEIPASGA
jgi:5'-nucleotidase